MVPNTQDLANQLDGFDWPHMIKDERLERLEHGITTIVPTFYMDECDWNHYDRPRLDLVVSFSDGEAVRYHRKCKMIWLPADPRDVAIAKRRQRLNLLRRNYGRDWEW